MVVDMNMEMKVVFQMWVVKNQVRARFDASSRQRSGRVRRGGYGKKETKVSDIEIKYKIV